MTQEIVLEQNTAAYFPTREEADEALQSYAHQFEMTSDIPSAYATFLDSHQVVQLEPALFAIALKPQASVFTFTRT